MQKVYFNKTQLFQDYLNNVISIETLFYLSKEIFNCPVVTKAQLTPAINNNFLLSVQSDIFKIPATLLKNKLILLLKYICLYE